MVHLITRPPSGFAQEGYAGQVAPPCPPKLLAQADRPAPRDLLFFIAARVMNSWEPFTISEQTIKQGGFRPLV